MPIAFYGQPGFKTVPDSLICLTPTALNVFISQSFDLKEARTTIVLKNNVISNLNAESLELRKEIIEKDREIDLRVLQTDVFRKDNEYLKDMVHVTNRKTRLLKTGLYIVGGIAIIELGYIGIKAIAK